MTTPPVLVTDVFTPGRQPIFTYNPRLERNLEKEVDLYLATGGSALVISGPTKSGKTVIVQRMLPPEKAVWINGADLRTIDDFWAAIVDFAGLYTDIGITSQTGLTETGKVGGKLAIPGVEVSGEVGGSTGTQNAVSATVRRRTATVAREALGILRLPIVIDDFHYVDATLQTEITRVIKTIVSSSPVILIAVPQDAFRPVQAETDMLGRVVQLQIEPWSLEELEYIAGSGFGVLNLVDVDSRVAKEFAKHSLGAPFLMQQLCLEYCLVNDFGEREDKQRVVSLPDDLLRFFERVARRNIPGVFDALRMGPRTKGQPRLERRLKNGESTDIYGAVLFGISKAGPVRSVTTQQLARKIGEYFVEQPKSQNVALALGHLSSIAHANRKGSDSVLDFKDDTLHIGDPFLSFYLRFGGWELPRPPQDSI